MRRRRKQRVIKCINPRLFDSMHKWPLLGIDEVGTGAIAGPVAAGAVVLPQDNAVLDLLESAGLKDSKQMTPGARDRVHDIIIKHSVFHAVEFIHPRELEQIGQGPALDKMFNALMAQFRLEWTEGGSIVLDGNKRKNIKFFHIAVHQGDQKSMSVAAASVIAKVTRDRMMEEYEDDFPGYGLATHHGYLTRTHKEALEKLGVAEIHRRNTKPIRKLMDPTS